MAKDEFKAFVKTKPELAKFVANGNMSWQKFYEMYNLYGEESDVWNEYSSDRDRVSLSKVTDIFRKVDVDQIKEHINTAQKALDFVQELTNKGDKITIKSAPNPKPLNKFFED